MIALGAALLLASAGPPACTALGQPLVEHACIHAKHGPFGDGAQPDPLPASSRLAAQGAATPAIPNVNRVHTYFRVALPAADTEGVVTYVPARGGEWAVFTNPGVPVTLLDPTGRPLAVRLEQDAPGCAELPRAAVYELEANTAYRLALGPSPAREVGLVLEKLSDFVLFYYPDEDGDARGGAGPAVETACLPPAGHVETDDDCDDRAGGVHPGATETCNGRDDNCDGKTDEGCPGAAGGSTPPPGSCQLVAGGGPASPPWLLALIVALAWLVRQAAFTGSRRTHR